MDPEYILIGVFALFSLAYLGLIWKLPFPGDFVIKSVPVLCLAVMAWWMVPEVTGKLLFAGFLFSAGGDISLSFTHRGEKYFLMGLGSFLIAHVLYVIAFARDFHFTTGDLPPMLIWVAFAVGMAVILFPKLGEMRLPVLVYVGVILAMVIAATGWQGLNPRMLISGAVLFMLSDSMIAVDKFLKPISWSKYFIMATYYAGQFLICWAFIG